MATFVNLTPHPIVVRKEDGSEFTITPSGVIARVSTTEKVVDSVDGVPVVTREFGEVENLPEPKDGTVYIVSSLVLSAVKGRKDVMAPDTGPTAIRDSNGHIVAVTRLVAAN